MRSWNQLLPFTAVMRERSFRRAATRLGITPAGMSQNIAQLERSLGVPLFHRTTRQLHPTDEAQKLFEAIGDLVEELDYSLRSVDQLKGEPAGLIRLALAPAFGKQRVLPVLEQFLRDYPKIDLDIHFGSHMAGNMQPGFDLIIGHGGGSTGFISRILCEMKPVLVASPRYLTRRGHPSAASDLLHHDQIVGRSPAGTVLHWRLRDPDDDAPADAATVHQSQSRITMAGNLDALRDAALAHLGIAAILEDYVIEQIENGALCRVLADHEVELTSPNYAKVHIQYPSRTFLPIRTRLLFDHIVREVTTRV